MTTSDELGLIKVIEESGWNIKELARKYVDSQIMVDQLLEKIEKIKEQYDNNEHSEQITPDFKKGSDKSDE